MASTDIHTAVQRMLDAYRMAVYAKDVGAFVALYAEDCVVFDMWARWSYKRA